jgi:hypothetical protein
MAMDHKAFVFRYAEFNRDLKPLLVAALVSRDPQQLVAFIDADRPSFRDPYEGETLPANWQALLETKDVDEFGDFVLTKYYDPREDIGLGRDWQEIQQALEDAFGMSGGILGQPLGVGEHIFDPGKMGSYFQSHEDVLRHMAQLKSAHGPYLQRAQELLRQAADQGEGLYVTF